MKKNHLRVVQENELPEGAKHRPIWSIAQEIKNDWLRINPHAQAYLKPMHSLNKIEDMYGLDTGESIVLYFLANSQNWRGPVARKIKQELKLILKNVDRELVRKNHEKAYS